MSSYKNIVLIFPLVRAAFLTSFALFYKTLEINIGSIIKNPEMLRFFPDHLKTKKMFKHAVKILSFVIR